MCLYPSSSAQRTALTVVGPLGTCHTPRPSSGISLPSASARVRASIVLEVVAMDVSLITASQHEVVYFGEIQYAAAARGRGCCRRGRQRQGGACNPELVTSGGQSAASAAR